MERTIRKKRQTNQSSTKLLRVLECVARSRLPIRLQDIAEQTGMSQSTVSRYLYALEDENYIYQESSTSRYATTWRVCCLTENVDSLLSLRNITTPFVNNLANTLSIGACLVIDRDSECLYLDCIDNPNSPTLQRIGKQAPMHATGSGKVLLSEYSEAKLNDFIEKKGLPKLTENTITSPEVLKSELKKVRECGYGLDEEECETNLRCISMPLRDYSGKIIAALSLFGQKYDMEDHRLFEQISPALKEATTVISMRLGYSPAQEKSATQKKNAW